MATERDDDRIRVTAGERGGGYAVGRRGSGGRGWDETKPSFKTTELLTLIAAVAAVLIAAAVLDDFDAPHAWTLVTILAVAYMLSRGLAKAGDRHYGDDDVR